MNDKDIFPARLKELRLNANLSQKEFADSIGLSPMSISSYETGNKTPSIDTAIRIAEKYNCSIDWLCGLRDEKDSKYTLETYSDLIKFLVELSQSPKISTNFSLSVEGANPYDDSPYTVAQITIDNITLVSFFDEWIDIQRACSKATNGKKLLKIWLDDVLKQYDRPIRNDTAESEPLPFA